MSFEKYKETVKSFLEAEIGYFVLTSLFNEVEVDLLDCMSACAQYMPPYYVFSREYYDYVL